MFACPLRRPNNIWWGVLLFFAKRFFLVLYNAHNPYIPEQFFPPVLVLSSFIFRAFIDFVRLQRKRRRADTIFSPTELGTCRECQMKFVYASSRVDVRVYWVQWYSIYMFFCITHTILQSVTDLTVGALVLLCWLDFHGRVGVYRAVQRKTTTNTKTKIALQKSHWQPQHHQHFHHTKNILLKSYLPKWKSNGDNIAHTIFWQYSER